MPEPTAASWRSAKRESNGRTPWGSKKLYPTGLMVNVHEGNEDRPRRIVPTQKKIVQCYNSSTVSKMVQLGATKLGDFDVQEILPALFGCCNRAPDRLAAS